MADIREEDFNRMQAQIIELRTANYDTEVKYQRQSNELEKLRETFSQIEKELEKSNKVIQKSKNRKEYALLVEENEGLQHRLRDNEEHFKLQNKTLLEEVARIEDENKKLAEEIKNLKSSKEGDSSPTHEAELRRLKAENVVLQKNLKSSLKAGLQKLVDKDSPQKPSEPDEDGESSATQETGEDASPITDDETGDKHRTMNEILDEFTEEINVTFETFWNDVERESKNIEVEDGECMDGEVSRGTSEDQNGDEIHCTLGQLENLKGNVQSRISSLLEEKVVSLKMNGSADNYDETNVKPSTQLTEIQLQLATEREEKRILEEQLAISEGNLRKEISRLEEEVNKLTEKAKRKQESLTQLQNEKENLFNENRKTIEEMKQARSRETKNLAERVAQSTEELESAKKELADHQKLSETKIKELETRLLDQETQATSNVEETIQELDNTRIENSSLTEQIHSLHEACESYRVENEDQKAMMITMQDKIKDVEDREIALKADNDKLKSEIEESRLSYEHLRRQVDETMGEKEQYINSANEAAKLAEKRKQMLDEFSIDQQKVVAEHKEQLERLESSYKDEARKSQDEFKKTIEDLKAQLQGEKKLKKDLQESQQQLADVTSQLTSLESKSGWFERRLAETEETLNEEKTKAADTIEQIKKEHETSMSDITTKHEASLQELNEKVATMTTDKQEQDGVIEKYKQEIKDKDVENVIAGKKGDHLVKDLKRQLKMERKKNEQLQQRLQEACSENRARENFETLFDPNVSKEGGRRNSVDSSMLSGSSLTNDDIKECSPDTSFNVNVNDETVDLISRVADLQQEKWQLEERVRLLEQSSSSMAEDLIRKSAVIQHYAMDTKIDSRKDVASPQGSNFKSRMKETFNIGKQEVLLKDMNSKLQRMLEETLVKNIQMQQDMDLLTKEQSSSSQQEQTANNSDKT